MRDRRAVARYAGLTGFTRRERKETPRERAGPLGQYPGPRRHDSIGVAVPSTPEEQRLTRVDPHRERSRYSKSHDVALARNYDRPVRLVGKGVVPDGVVLRPAYEWRSLKDTQQFGPVLHW